MSATCTLVQYALYRQCRDIAPSHWGTAKSSLERLYYWAFLAAVSLTLLARLDSKAGAHKKQHDRLFPHVQHTILSSVLSTGY